MVPKFAFKYTDPATHAVSYKFLLNKNNSPRRGEKYQVVFDQTKMERVMPFYEDHIAPALKQGKNVLVAAHGNSLRALCKYLENISDERIPGLEIATGQPIVYELSDKLEIVNKTILTEK